MKKVINRAWRAKMQVLVWLLIISLIVPMLPPPRAAAAGLPIQPTTVTTTAIPFRDVSPTDWFYDAVVKMQEKGIFSGTDANNFSPKGTMTRAMYVTALGRMAGVDVSAYTTSSFADVSANSWYAPYIAWAVAQGITDGTGSGSFSPNGTVSREQMATMTLRYFESYGIPYRTTSPVTTQPGDLTSVSAWAKDAVLKLWQAGIFSGDNNGNFNPKAQASRAEAATLFMRNVEVVEAWKAQNPATPTPTPTPTPSPTPTPTTGGNSSNNGGETGGGNGNGNENGNGSTPGGGSNAYTLTFESNGGSAIAAQSVQPNQVLTNLPAPTKDGFIFQGWFTDRELTLIFASGSTISDNTTLYAKYTDSIDTAVQSVPSYSVLDVAPNYTIQIVDLTSSLTAEQVKEGMKFVDTANSDLAGIRVTGGSGQFTVASAAEDGKFVEGHTYQLTLTNDDLTFDGQDATTDIYVFSVAKQEVLDIPLNPNMIYLHFDDISGMVLNGADVDSPSISVMATTVGGSGDSLAAANAANGTFEYTGSTVIQAGDTVAIYTGIRPDQRTVATDGIDDGEIAYVQITAVDGSTYSYGRAEADQVVFKPDVLPVSVGADTDGDSTNRSITVEHVALNYSDEQYEPLGLDELTTVDVGDFIGFYEGVFAEEGFKSVGYGRITSITPAAEMDIITYTDATIEEVTSAFDLYQKQAVNGEQLLTDEQIDQLESQIEQQATESGFVDQAADYLSDVAMETQEFKAQTFLAGKGSRVSVENLTVAASLDTKLKNIKGRTSGVSATLQVNADIVVEVNDDTSMVIHMTGTFVQEISLDLGINSDTSWHWYTVSTWLGDIPIFPVIDDYVITANLDAYTYTGMNIKAEIGFAEPDELEDVLENWVDAQTSGKLSQVKNIASQIEAVLNGPKDTDDVDADSLREQYKEMLEKETQWATLIKKTLVEKSVRVALGIVEVKFEAEFVVSAQVNLTIGADFYYKMAKRYSVTVRVLSFSGSSNTVSLPEDGDYQFTFYVMGTLGLRAGIHMEVKAGIGSVDLNSIGVAVEPGVYINLWGYFYYQLKNISGVKTTKSMGALFVEIGIYLEAELGAQLGDGALSDGIELASEEWPLYTLGKQDNVYDFAYEQDEALGFTMAGSVSSIAVPESWLTMSTLDLKTGDTDTRAYPPSNFDIQMDNPNFKYDQGTGKITVVDTKRPVSKGNVVITWKGAPLSFTADPIKRILPLTWRTTEGEYIFQLHPGNGGVTQVLPYVYNATVQVATPVYPGYTFEGWYTEAVGGEKFSIPSRMPKDDYELYAHWTANTNTPYMVEHYLVDPNSRVSTAQPVYTEMLTGTTDTEIRINSDRYKDQGYRTGTVSGVRIKGDGSTVVRVEYYPNSYKLTFDWDYAGAPVTSLTEAMGKNIASRVPVPTRQAYTFAGWEPNVPSVMPSSNMTYTAKWIGREDTPYQVVYLLQNIGSDTYTVADTESYRGVTDAEATLDNVTLRSYKGFQFDKNIPGTVLTSQIASNGKTVLKLYYKRDAHTLTIDYNGSGQPTKVLEVPSGATTQLYLGMPAWQGHVFAGWLPTPPTIMPEESITVTAQWTTNTYTVSFNNSGGAAETDSQSVAYGETASVPIEPTKEGYVFGGWYSESDPTTAYDFASPITGDLNLYAKWLLRYTVSFESNEGSAVNAQTVNEGEKASVPVVPEREGYVFGGWYSDSDLNSPYDFTTSVVTVDLTLYAKWSVYVPNTYTVAFESNGGSSVEPQTVSEGAVAKAPANPTRDSYTFSGWYSDRNFATPYGFTAGITADITLYAKWTKKSYTVTFNSNQGSTVSSQSVEEGTTATTPANPTRGGYTFSGWYSDIGLQNAYSFAKPVTANLTLYAKWTALYTVSFNSEGGSSVASQTVEYDGKVIRPNAPTKEGYTFIGWYSEAGLNEVYNFATSVTSDLTLYASWKLNTHTVTFESGGGSSVQSQIIATGANATAPVAPKWEGYRFDGWYKENTFTTAYAFTTPVTADVTLYAKWTMTAWIPVGDALDAGAYYQTDFVLDSQGVPYVALVTSAKEISVMKYEDGQWQTVGQPTDFDQQWLPIFSPQQRTTYLKLAIDGNGTPYLAYNGYLDNTTQFIVMKYTNGAWERMTDVQGVDEQFERHNAAFAFDQDNTPYLSYASTANSPNNYTRLVKYKNGNWEEIDRVSSSNTNDKPAINFDQNGNLYMFYTTYVYKASGDSKNTAHVVRYEQNGKGSGGNDPSRSETSTDIGSSYSFSLDPQVVPYLAFFDSSRKVTVVKYTGSAWETVGTTGISIGTGNTITPRLAISSQGTPYVAYRDVTNLKAPVVKVIQYKNGNWVPAEYDGIPTKSIEEIKLGVDSTGVIYVSYFLNGQVYVMKHDPKLYQP